MARIPDDSDGDNLSTFLAEADLPLALARARRGDATREALASFVSESAPRSVRPTSEPDRPSVQSSELRQEPTTRPSRPLNANATTREITLLLAQPDARPPRAVASAAALVVGTAGAFWFVFSETTLLQRPHVSVIASPAISPVLPSRDIWPSSVPAIVADTTGRSLESNTEALNPPGGAAAANLALSTTPTLSSSSALTGVTASVDVSANSLPSASPSSIHVTAVATNAASSDGEEVVRQALHWYQDGYANLDATAAAAVWPSEDRRALSRAFATLKSQGLEFRRCAVTMSDAHATVSCRATLQVAPKAGDRVPLTTDQEWVFKMRRIGPDWKIDDVSATPPSAGRTGGQD